VGPLVTDNAQAALVAAIDGLGVALTADWLVGPALRSGKLVEVLPGWTGENPLLITL
jgi:DNA-binding transcriptional LysR family regulator